MAVKYLIQCPICKTFHEVKSGLFGTKFVDCNCGYTINVKDSRFITKKCPHCGNMIVCDQKLGDSAVCPICHQQVNATEDKVKFIDINCPHCNSKVKVRKDADTDVCPVCSKDIDIKKVIEVTKVSNNNQPVLIRYDGGDGTLAYKHPMRNFPMGSQLIVSEGQTALFVKDGQIYDSFTAGRYALDLQIMPLYSELKTDKNAVDADVYYLSSAPQLGIKWGTDSKISLFDPASGLPIEIGASGTFGIRVSNGPQFLKYLLGGMSGETLSKAGNVEDFYSNNSITSKFRTLIVAHVKETLSKIIRKFNINILAIDERLIVISNLIKEEINLELMHYGVEIVDFYVAGILFPEDDPNFKELRNQYAQKYLGVNEENIAFEKESAAQKRRILEAQTQAEEMRIKARAEAYATRVVGQAEADEMTAKGYTYQDETQRMVSVGAVENEGNATINMAVGLGVAKGITFAVTDSVERSVESVPSHGTTASWDCKCGENNLTSNFCPVCGAKKIVFWNCSCGETDIKGNFCPNCGKARP